MTENVFRKAGMKNTAFYDPLPIYAKKRMVGIPELYERNGYVFEFLFLLDNKEPLCIYKDGQNDDIRVIKKIFFCIWHFKKDRNEENYGKLGERSKKSLE